MNKEFLERILETISVSGYEEPLQDVVELEMSRYADKITRDEMSNQICIMNPESQNRIMLSAHADEIGLMVSNFTSSGKLQVVSRGGIILHTYPGQQVCIKTKTGFIYGVIESDRELLKKEDLKVKDFLINIGVDSEEEAKQIVDLGAPIVLDTHIRYLAGNKLTARALDDKIGVYIIMEALKRAKEQGCLNGVYAAATVGEETTKSGAYWASARINPTLAIVVDVTYTSDSLGIDPSETGPVLLGNGPVLCNSPIVVKQLNYRMEEIGKKAGIPLQREAASNFSYTDGDKIHFSNAGVPIILVSIPLKNMHTPAEVVDLLDVEGAIALITKFLMEY